MLNSSNSIKLYSYIWSDESLAAATGSKPEPLCAIKKDLMQNNKWKDYLLKSGLPFEFEVKKVLDKLGFWSKNEFAYFRENENNILTEFSYDIDSEILIKEHYFELLIECLISKISPSVLKPIFMRALLLSA